jgi:hypothetical protein
VLVGQLNLLEVLRQPSLRQLDQRVSIRCVLQPLDRAGVNAYISHRLAVAGGSTPVTFTPDAVDLVFGLSGGVPRIVNLVCDRALMRGADARTDRITPSLIQQAARLLGLQTPEEPPVLPEAPPAVAESPITAAATPPTGFRRSAAALVGLMAVAAAAYWWFTVRPLTSLERGDLPAPGNLSPAAIGVPAPPRLPAPETLPALPPPIEEGAFSVLVGTYETGREVEQTAKALLDRKLPAYAVSLRIDGSVRRRVLVGRYATREEAQQIRTDLLADFPEVRLLYGWFERVP